VKATLTSVTQGANITINLYRLIIFLDKHVLLPLLYLISVDTSFENILKGVNCCVREGRGRGREGEGEGEREREREREGK
jgi:hypothetical protein